MIKNIVFDMGNVLLRYDPEVPLALFCRTPEEKEAVRTELFGGQEWVAGDLGTMTQEEKYESIKKRIPEEMHTSLRRCVYEWSVCMKPISGAFSFCEYAKKKGYRLFVLSNASSEFYEYFPEFAPLSYFDGIVVSSDIHIIKPEEGIYRYLLDTYGLLPGECLFIDDMEANVKAARRMGMQGEVFCGDFEPIREKYGI
ncbi:alpha-D-glucose 1-phosphate phosphatase YihX [Lachnospiraceae bacterium]|nr:alpha-D-glucose 1-phosphate phosphatase YihX [Lachnospiraceae bacterium]